EVPVGAIIVVEDEVIGRGHNRREALQDPTAHAEMIALREACQKLNSWRLIDATMYVTLEPCSMCAGALVLTRIKHLVYGVLDPKAGAVGSLYNLLQDPRLNHQALVTSGIMQEACSEILKNFFQDLRRQGAQSG
ncbi:MAG: tRNA adenosine(34) deaminase TadA, partial [Nitrospira sp.]|nr:tRNA adenosine(34) deaminase TadA [Nitrospira sp.]